MTFETTETVVTYFINLKLNTCKNLTVKIYI
jgi:hypothetical protein